MLISNNNTYMTKKLQKEMLEMSQILTTFVTSASGKREDQ
jgi:hypothetical protein